MTYTERLRKLRLGIANGESPGEVISRDSSPFTTTEELLNKHRELSAGLHGLTPQLAYLLEKPGVTDLLINEPGQVWLDRGQGLESQAFPSLQTEQQVRELAVRMAAAAGARLDESSPIADANMPSGLRLHAVLPPVSGSCAAISVRTRRSQAFTMEQLQENAMFSPQLGEFLRRAIQAHMSILISGATGSGKTTLLATLLGLIPHTERLICIEEVCELSPAHPHVVHLQARAANIQSRGAVSLSQLVKAAMRMRPDRLILGEARGEEVREMLCALNTGHSGGLATIHANSAQDIPARLEALGALAQMDRLGVCAQALSAFDMLVHLGKTVGNPGEPARRWIREIAVLRRDSDGYLKAEKAAQFTPTGERKTSKAWTELNEKLQNAGDN